MSPRRKRVDLVRKKSWIDSLPPLFLPDPLPSLSLLFLSPSFIISIVLGSAIEALSFDVGTQGSAAKLREEEEQFRLDMRVFATFSVHAAVVPTLNLFTKVALCLYCFIPGLVSTLIVNF